MKGIHKRKKKQRTFHPSFIFERLVTMLPEYFHLPESSLNFLAALNVICL